MQKIILESWLDVREHVGKSHTASGKDNRSTNLESNMLISKKVKNVLYDLAVILLDVEKHT